MAFGKINIFEANWVNLVFKGRNQSYGAYVLRKESDTNTVKGIIYAIIFFTLFISAPVIINYIKALAPEEIEEVKVTEVTTLDAPPPVDKDEPPPPPPPPPPPLKSTIKFVPPEIAPDKDVPDEPPPTIDEMKDKVVASQTVEGDPEGVDIGLLEEGDGVVGEENQIVEFAEQQAEFPGGLDAMHEFLSRNISYPSMARENGIEGRVILRFVVNKEGKISDIEVLKKLGWGLEEEAVRVVKKMPDWKPAKQNGKPVILRMTLPVMFKLQ